MCNGWKVENRIACDECNYPESEAKYPNLLAYNKMRTEKGYPKIHECEICGCILSENNNYIAINHKYYCGVGEICLTNVLS